MTFLHIVSMAVTQIMILFTAFVFPRTSLALTAYFTAVHFNIFG